MRFGVDGLTLVEKNWIRVGTIDGHRLQSSIDDPDDGDSGFQVEQDLLVDLLLRIGRGEDLDGQQWGPLKVGGVLVRIRDLVAHVGDVNAYKSIRDAPKSETGSTDDLASIADAGILPGT